MKNWLLMSISLMLIINIDRQFLSDGTLSKQVSVSSIAKRYKPKDVARTLRRNYLKVFHKKWYHKMGMLEELPRLYKGLHVPAQCPFRGRAR